MSKNSDSPEAANPANHGLPLLLDYGCSHWRSSSQRAADLYDAGNKLWSKKHLQDIEHQLAQSEIREMFTVFSIDGNMVQIQNPMFGVQRPIWRPYVKFQEYWRLVKTEPDTSPETYHCSYLVDWSNQTARNFRGLTENQSSIFGQERLFWKASASCKLLRLRFKELLVSRKVTKILCFGLGDMSREPPEWLRRRHDSSDQGSDANIPRGNMIQHAIALTMAEVCCESGANEVQLMAQDPDYTEQTKEILEKNGFTIVGQFGAGGFAEIDEESVVFSAFVEAPLKQIIADIARPTVIIGTTFGAFNDNEKPWADADSPRTKQMWQEYENFAFPISPEDRERLSNLCKLQFYVRK